MNSEEKDIKEDNLSKISLHDKIRKSSLCKHSKILIVDDCEFNLKCMEMILQNIDAKYICDKARNGKEAIDMVLEKLKDSTCKCRYQYILMDCNMPIMNGYTACDILKNMIKAGDI